MRSVRLLIVDPSPLWRQGFMKALEENLEIEVVGEAGSGRDAVEQCKRLRPDIVTTECILPDMHGEHLIRVIRRRYRKITIVVLASTVSKGLVRMMLDAGAHGYILKNTPSVDMLTAVQNACLGKTTFAPEAIDALVLSIQQPPLSYLQLTGRERQVLSLMVKGSRNADIADKLTISIFTVKKHVESILKKLNVRNRTEATAFTLKQNLLADWFVDEHWKQTDD